MPKELRNFQGNDDKLTQLILYVAQKCADQRGFGSTKLNKILYVSDFVTYGVTGQPLTGVEYQRLKWGPAPRRMKPILLDLINTGKLAMQETVDIFGNVTKKPVNLVQPNLDTFSAREIAIIDQMIDLCHHMTAGQISDYSHRWGGWRYALDGETIPYESVFIDNKPLTEVEIERGLEVARKRDLLAG